MHVIVLTKKQWVTMLVIALLLIAGIAAAVIALCMQEDEPASVPTMAQVESYELQTIPLLAREIPVYSVNRDDKAIALTIDAAWDADKTKTILEILDRYDVKATFFLCGVWVDAYPEMVKEIAARGHVIGNHSLTHPHMNRLSEAEIQNELTKLDDTIEQLTGKRCTLFRAPFGEYNDTVVKTVRSLGYEIVQWDVDSVDWKEGRSAETILNSVLKKLQSGSIILSHNNGYHIETYLPKLLETAIADGYHFVTVPELLPEGNHTIDNNGVWQPQ